MRYLPEILTQSSSGRQLNSRRTFVTTSKNNFKKLEWHSFERKPPPKQLIYRALKSGFGMQNSYICSYPAVVKISFKILDLDSHSDRTTGIKWFAVSETPRLSRKFYNLYQYYKFYNSSTASSVIGKTRIQLPRSCSGKKKIPYRISCRLSASWFCGSPSTSNLFFASGTHPTHPEKFIEI